MDILFGELLKLFAEEVLLFLVCLFCIIVGAKRSLTAFLQEEKNRNEDVQVMTVSANMAVAAPIVGSISLLIFFFYFSLLQFIMSSSMIAVSTIALVFSIQPLCGFLPPRRVDVPCVGLVSVASVAAVALAVTVVSTWVLTNNWILLNVVDVAIVIWMLCYIRLSNLNVATLLLGGLLIYDIFWVFYSEKLFKKNVMVTVAEKQASNPVASVAIQAGFQLPHLDLPGKFIVVGILSGNISLLGLGDVVLPGLMLCFVKRFDHLRSSTKNATAETCSYFSVGLLGYSVGLYSSFLSSVLFHVAQPALLYLVPFSLLPIILLAISRREFNDIWHGQISMKALTPFTV